MDRIAVASTALAMRALRRAGKTILDFDEEMMGWQWHQLDHMQITCTSLQTDNHTSTSSLNFYRPDALPDAQPTMSKH